MQGLQLYLTAEKGQADRDNDGNRKAFYWMFSMRQSPFANVQVVACKNAFQHSATSPIHDSCMPLEWALINFNNMSISKLVLKYNILLLVSSQKRWMSIVDHIARCIINV